MCCVCEKLQVTLKHSEPHRLQPNDKHNMRSSVEHPSQPRLSTFWPDLQDLTWITDSSLLESLSEVSSELMAAIFKTLRENRITSEKIKSLHELKHRFCVFICLFLPAGGKNKQSKYLLLLAVKRKGKFLVAEEPSVSVLSSPPGHSEIEDSRISRF